jgi:LuxR family maltose regulon positive regulatory protein
VNAIQKLVEQAPDGLKLVIATRNPGRLPLDDWSQKGWLLQIGAADLRLAEDETAAVLEERIPGVPAAVARRVGECTEGWAAGVQLAAVSLEGHGLDETLLLSLVDRYAAPNRFLADYLSAEVLSEQAERVLRFLRLTSVLDGMCPALCDAVVGGTDSAAMLATARWPTAPTSLRSRRGCCTSPAMARKAPATSRARRITTILR